MDPFEGDSPKNYEELGDPVDGEPMVDPITGKKIVRPRNAWILYRNARLGHVERLPDGSAQPMAAASKIISKWWKAESKEVKNEYELLAEREKAEHKQKYPNYRFQPKSKVQKQREQAAKKEAKNKAKAANKKNRAASATMTSFASSVHTSYVAAALANQQATQAPMFGPGSLSPPLSLASTPITSPSPLSSFDPEPSSSSTPATSFSSPFNALDSGSFSSLDFSGQDAALSRVPQHVPPRLPPRIRGQVSTSSTAGSSTDTSSGLQLPSPAPTSAPGGSSPLPWPTTAPQYFPESQASSPPAVPMPSAAASPPPGPWIDESLYEAVPEDSAPVSVELGFPSNGIDFSQFGDYFDFDGLLGLDNADNGTIFQMPSENFLTSAPGQIDVSINCPQPVSGVTLEESTAFSEVLGSFNFPAFQEGSSMQLPSQYTSDGLMSQETWNFDASLTRLGSGLDLGIEHALVNGEDLLASYMTQDVLEEQPMIQDVIPIMEHPTPPPEPTQPTQPIAHSTVQSDPPQSSSLTVRLDEIPAFLRETPQFQAWLAGKVSNQPSTSQQPQSQDFNNAQQHQFFQPASFQQFSTQDMFSMQQQYYAVSAPAELPAITTAGTDGIRLVAIWTTRCFPPFVF
ncbi:hypothetical protein EW026_g6120 [Hermanssonia centrifuga]|uniref:HMG box domain-containing protein n=1 Tax=Hermanssonia centrifuga TaxID=98765 RepID=A0A4S4KBZ9_9APHY|nr:hypothetical protein EW026_g6120 [Hermanssonia centrifuga]